MGISRDEEKPAVSQWLHFSLLKAKWSEDTEITVHKDAKEFIELGLDGQGYIFEFNFESSELVLFPAYNKDGYSLVLNYSNVPTDPKESDQFIVYLENDEVKYVAKDEKGIVQRGQLDEKDLGTSLQSIKETLKDKNGATNFPPTAKKVISEVATKLGFSEYKPQVTKEGKPFRHVLVSSQPRTGLAGDLHTMGVRKAGWGHLGGVAGMIAGGGIFISVINGVITIKFAFNRSTSQNLFSIKYTNIYRQYFNMRVNRHGAHMLNLPREIPLPIFEKIMNAIHKAFNIPQAAKFLDNAYLDDGSPNSILSHLMVEQDYCKNPAKAHLELFHYILFTALKSKKIFPEDITLLKELLNKKDANYSDLLGYLNADEVKKLISMNPEMQYIMLEMAYPLLEASAKSGISMEQTNMLSRIPSNVFALLEPSRITPLIIKICLRNDCYEIREILKKISFDKFDADQYFTMIETILKGNPPGPSSLLEVLDKIPKRFILMPRYIQLIHDSCEKNQEELFYWLIQKTHLDLAISDKSIKKNQDTDSKIDVTDFKLDDAELKSEVIESKTQELSKEDCELLLGKTYKNNNIDIFKTIISHLLYTKKYSAENCFNLLQDLCKTNKINFVQALFSKLTPTIKIELMALFGTPGKPTIDELIQKNPEIFFLLVNKGLLDKNHCKAICQQLVATKDFSLVAKIYHSLNDSNKELLMHELINKYDDCLMNESAENKDNNETLNKILSQIPSPLLKIMDDNSRFKKTMAMKFELWAFLGDLTEKSSNLFKNNLFTTCKKLIDMATNPGEFSEIFNLIIIISLQKIKFGFSETTSLGARLQKLINSDRYAFLRRELVLDKPVSQEHLKRRVMELEGKKPQTDFDEVTLFTKDNRSANKAELEKRVEKFESNLKQKHATSETLLSELSKGKRPG
jgi:hypothetical protein